MEQYKANCLTLIGADRTGIDWLDGIIHVFADAAHLGTRVIMTPVAVTRSYFASKGLTIMRYAFGGHDEKKPVRVIQICYTNRLNHSNKVIG